MAFNIKQSKRQTAPEETQVCPNNQNSNIVATRSWVWNLIQKFGGWKNLFKTKSLEVAEGASIGRLATDEI